MAKHIVDITELAVLGERFPLRLWQLGFQLMHVLDEAGQEQFRYVLPPVCEVPAGPFLMGSDRQHDAHAQDDEISQSALALPAFQISTYPLTVAEYACAVEVGVVAPPEAWTADITWRVQQQRPDHPVVCITWHEASAYAAWLAEVTASAWRLPTEAEWEKAARGSDGRRYPLGNQWDQTKANTWDGRPNATTPVGTYVEYGDASPYGVHDMAGNVWEWTSSIYQERLPYRAEQSENEADITSPRVLRGGSWGSQHGSVEARAVRRAAYLPASFRTTDGVRLARGVAAAAKPRAPRSCCTFCARQRGWFRGGVKKAERASDENRSAMVSGIGRAAFRRCSPARESLPMSDRYASAYIRYCQEIVSTFEDHLHRHLTFHERRWCENCGSLLMLERVDQGMATLQSEAAFAQYLYDMATWTEQCFQETWEAFCVRLVSLVQRDLTASERQALQQHGTISRWYQFVEHVADIPGDLQRQFAEQWIATWEEVNS